MTSEPDELRARLLGEEPVSPARREQLQQEVCNVFEQKLTRGWRVYWAAGLVAAVAFAAFGGAVLIYGRMDGFLRGVWWLYTLANAGFVFLAAYILRAGRIDLRRFMQWAKLSPALTLLIVLLLFARAAAAPSLESVLWVLFGLICLLVALAVTILNRVGTAELSQREQVLRLELRVLELLERGQKGC